MSDEHRPTAALGRTRDGAHGAHRPLRVRTPGLPGQTDRPTSAWVPLSSCDTGGPAGADARRRRLGLVTGAVTNFFDNLWIETSDYKFPNGTIGKIVTYNMEERERVKIVNYEGTKEIDRTKPLAIWVVPR